MKNYEKYDGEERRKEVVREELDRLVDFVLANEVGKRLKEEEFEGKGEGEYRQEEIARDKRTVQSIKTRLAEEADHLETEVREEQTRIRKRAEALEIVIADQGELNGWFGLNAFLVRLTEYDDYVNGVDIVVEFDMGEGEAAERFAVAIDASFGTQGDTIERKIRRNIRKILGVKEKNGEPASPAEVKYFRSEIDDHKERLKMVVPVVVGIDRRHTNQIMGLFADLIKLRQQDAFYTKRGDKENLRNTRGKIKDKNMRLAEHPVQMVLVEEIVKQLEMYLHLLDEAAPDRQEIYTTRTKTLLGIFKEILKEKEEISREAVNDDRVFSKVKEITEGQRTSRSFNPR